MRNKDCFLGEIPKPLEKKILNRFLTDRGKYLLKSTVVRYSKGFYVYFKNISIHGQEEICSII